MNIEKLRKKHPTFIYKSFNVKKTNRLLEIKFKFQISPNIEFSPHVSIPVSGSIDKHEVSNFAFHLGLIEAISYWKSTCSPQIIVKAGRLTNEQIEWWHNLFIHGLGEFYYCNNINFSSPNFITISPSNSAPKHPTAPIKQTKHDLILVGGGKDSIVTLSTLLRNRVKSNVLMLNPTTAMEKTAQITGFKNPIIIKRTIDKRLLELNKKGYLNGHTPFSAYLSFIGVFVGFLYGFKHVIASNESSASEGSLKLYDIDINHQYSKSFDYEKRFDKYRRKFLTKDTVYFSFLRPLSELQIALLFAKTRGYDKIFCSCNISRNQYWCGTCPKCAFVYLLLSAAMERKRIIDIFGASDYFKNTHIQKYIIDLVGLGKHKPFDCVGTEHESKQAIILAIANYKKQKLTLPDFLVTIAKKLHLKTKNKTYAALIQKIAKEWDTEHILPKKYEQMLKKTVMGLSS